MNKSSYLSKPRQRGWWPRNPAVKPSVLLSNLQGCSLITAFFSSFVLNQHTGLYCSPTSQLIIYAFLTALFSKCLGFLWFSVSFLCLWSLKVADRGDCGQTTAEDVGGLSTPHPHHRSCHCSVKSLLQRLLFNLKAQSVSASSLDWQTYNMQDLADQELILQGKRQPRPTGAGLGGQVVLLLLLRFCRTIAKFQKRVNLTANVLFFLLTCHIQSSMCLCQMTADWTFKVGPI